MCEIETIDSTDPTIWLSAWKARLEAQPDEPTNEEQMKRWFFYAIQSGRNETSKVKDFQKTLESSFLENEYF